MKKLLAISLFFFFINTSAADQCTTWGCVSTISEIYTNVTGIVNIATPLDEQNANCAPNQGKYFTLDLTKPNGKEVYATLLAAYIAKEKIQLRITEGVANCPLSYVRLSTNH